MPNGQTNDERYVMKPSISLRDYKQVGAADYLDEGIDEVGCATRVCRSPSLGDKRGYAGSLTRSTT